MNGATHVQIRHWLRILIARIHGLLRRDAIAEEIREELHFHMDMRTEEYQRRGLSPEAAHREAKRRVGNLALHQDRGYDVRGGGVMETIVQDVRYSARLLLKQRGFAAVAIATLALAIGAVTAVVSVIDATMLRPLPYPDPEQLVDLRVRMPLRPGDQPRNLGPSMEDMRNWQSTDNVFSSVATSRSVMFGRIIDGEQPERVQIREVTEQYVRMHGLAPLHGRDFTRDDVDTGASVVILGHGYWQRRFGGDPGAVGEVLHIGDTSATVIGVLPPGLEDDRVLRPLVLEPSRYAQRAGGTTVNARLLPGVSTEQAAERLSASLDELPGPDGSTIDASAVVLSRLDSATSQYRTTVRVLAGAVAFILLLACVNVAGLQLARGTTRQPELAVRASLGAGRSRLVRQLLVESAVVATAGAVVGVLMARLALDALVANLPMSLPANVPVRINLFVLSTSAAVTAITAVLFGLVPALRLSRAGVGLARVGARGRHGSSLSRRGSQLLITAEIGLAVVLVVGAALMLRSFARVMAVDLGIDPDTFYTLQVVPIADDPAVQGTYYPALVRQLKLIPGIAAAGAVDHHPLSTSSTGALVSVEGRPAPAAMRRVLPGYIEAVGLPLVSGRTLSDADYVAGASFVMINESAARELFADGSGVGRSLATFDTDDEGNRIEVPWEVIGVVGDVRHGGPLQQAGPEVYLPFRPSGYAIEPAHALTVVVRPNTRIPDIAHRLREAAESVGPRVLVEGVRSGNDWLAERLITPRQRTVLLGLLGSLGLLLALVGVFGLTAYAVARRTREIGVRMTFGARPAQVVGTITRDSALPVIAGIVIGMAGAVMATRLIESFLFETTPTDPATFAAVAVALAVAGCAAAWIPARRAVRIDPVTALRTE